MSGSTEHLETTDLDLGHLKDEENISRGEFERVNCEHQKCK